MKQTTVAAVDVARTPRAGDVIEIKGKTKLVIAGGRSTSRDENRGDSYWVDYFDTIDVASVDTVNPKVTHYILKGGCMGKDNAIEIAPDDIVLVRTGKLSTHTETRYTVK